MHYNFVLLMRFPAANNLVLGRMLSVQEREASQTTAGFLKFATLFEYRSKYSKHITSFSS